MYFLVNFMLIFRHVEAHFFYENFLWNLGADFYKELLPESDDDDIVYEGTPRYFVEKNVPERVKKVNPNMKFIVIICEPIKESLLIFIMGALIISRKIFI